MLQLLPKDEADERDVILEIRAGTGGEEASLFAADLFRMYTRFAQAQGWRFETVEASQSPLLSLAVLLRVLATATARCSAPASSDRCLRSGSEPMVHYHNVPLRKPKANFQLDPFQLSPASHFASCWEVPDNHDVES